MPSDQPIPSDLAPTVLAAGSGAVTCSVLSLSARDPEGDDARYLQWHMLDHLPEQYRIASIRSGQRWVSTARCRGARFVSQAPFDQVDHIVSYLFAEPSAPALGAFFDLGRQLHRLGRMPMALPRVHVGVWDVVDKAANPTVLAGADVIPWRPSQGAYLIIDRPRQDSPARSERTARLARLDGVAGAWRFHGASRRHRRAEDCGDLEAILCYIDADPVTTATAIAEVLAAHPVPGSSLLLAAPFASVVPFDWDGALPGR